MRNHTRSRFVAADAMNVLNAAQAAPATAPAAQALPSLSCWVTRFYPAIAIAMNPHRFQRRIPEAVRRMAKTPQNAHFAKLSNLN